MHAQHVALFNKRMLLLLDTSFSPTYGGIDSCRAAVMPQPNAYHPGLIMKMNLENPSVARRRLMIAASTLGVGLFAGIESTFAATFPARDIMFTIPNAAGGSYDTYVRTIGPAMVPFLANKIAVVPNNVEGAGGARQGNILARAKPDGYTIGVLNVMGLLLLKHKGGNLGFELNDLTWIGNLARDHYALVVSADSKIRTVDDLRALSRQRLIKFTSSGPETMSQAATLIGSSLLNIRAQVIAGYRGTSDCLVAVLRGDGDATVLSLPAMTEMVASKLVRVVASFETKSSVPGAADATTLNLPELAQIIELRPIAGPPKLPSEIVAPLSAALNQAMASPKVVSWAKHTGANLEPMSPADTSALIKHQTEFINRWTKYLPTI